jgi:hypothetical protein
MPTREIVCACCGKVGKIDVGDLNHGITSSSIFKYLGHNSLSGHMYFQCPVCKMVCWATPFSVLRAGLVITQACPSIEIEDRWTSFISDLRDIGRKFALKRPSWLSF